MCSTYLSSFFLLSFIYRGMGGKAASDLGARLPPVRPKELTAVLSSFLSHGECLTDIVKVPARRGGLNGAIYTSLV